MEQNASYQLGSGKAMASLLLGILSTLMLLPWWGGAGIGLVLGIVGLCLAHASKKEGYINGRRTAGLVLSLIGVVRNSINLLMIIFNIGWAIFAR